VGLYVGAEDGLNVGALVGSAVGLVVGSCVGLSVGDTVGILDGLEVGAVVGASVTEGSRHSKKPLEPHVSTPSTHVAAQQSPPSQSQSAVLKFK
jgi:outer membrane lipoprotein SlyB